MSKDKAKQELKEAVELFWLSIEAYQKENHFFHWNNGLKLLKNQVKRFGAAIKADLGGNKFKKVVNDNPAPIPQPRKIEEPEPEEGVSLADNAETPKAKKEATKKRRSRKKKA